MTNSLDAIEFDVAAEVESPNWRTNWGHRKAIASRARIAVDSAVNGIPAPQWEAYAITITRIGANVMDDDNLIASCKAVRDAIASWLGIDDGSERIEWSYSQRVERVRDETPRAKRAYRTWVSVSVAPRAQLEAPRGVILSGKGEGGGTDTPSNNVKNIPSPGPNSANIPSSSENNPTEHPKPLTPETFAAAVKEGRALGAKIRRDIARMHEVSPEAASARARGPGLVRLPPGRLERERTKAPIREDQDRTKPTREVVVARRANGSTLRLARIDDVHGSRLRLAVHYLQQGHAWRTTGVAIELPELELLREALDEYTGRG